jgi:hypothetical protein
MVLECLMRGASRCTFAAVIPKKLSLGVLEVIVAALFRSILSWGSAGDSAKESDTYWKTENYTT